MRQRRRTPAQRTALQIASMRGYEQAVEYLLDHGADLKAAAASKNGRTALQGAVDVDIKTW